MSKGKLTTIAPDGRHTEQRFETAKGAALTDLQAAVGGYIERVRVRFNGRVRDAYVNEDGYSKGLLVNRPAMAILAEPFTGAVILGNVAVCEPDPKAKRELIEDSEVDI
jgi:hypothetical protein